MAGSRVPDRKEKVRRTMGKRLMAVGVIALALMLVLGCSKGPGEESKAQSGVDMASLISHLEGKTVVLRWNSKLNGDKLLDRLAELLTQQVPGVNVVKAYVEDPSTVAVTETPEESLQIANTIAALNPDLVIASQAD